MSDETSDDAQEPTPRKGGALKILLPAGLVGLVLAGGGGFFALGGPSLLSGATAAEAPAEASSSYSKGKDSKKKDGGEQIKVLELEAFVVSLRGDETSRRPPRLRFVVAVEGMDGKSPPVKVYRLRNEILLAVHDVDLATLRGPNGIDALRAAIVKRTGENLDFALDKVLITDYILL